jgi:toxin ParE1/3/4
MSIARHPATGGAPPPELAPELRSFPVGRYVVFYRPQDDGFDVVRVLHSARDIESISEEGGFDENT